MLTGKKLSNSINKNALFLQWQILDSYKSQRKDKQLEKYRVTKTYYMWKEIKWKQTYIHISIL